MQKSISYQKGVTSKLFDFNIVQIRRVSFFRDTSYKINIDFFFESQSCFCLVFLRPGCEGIGSGL